jgi:hypothetical protein
MVNIRHFIGLALGSIASAATASVFTLDTTIGAANDPIAATAVFTWSGSTLELRLTNDTDSITRTIQELTGIHFILSGSPVLVDVNGSAAGTVDCIGIAANAPCAIDNTTVDPLGTPADLDPGGAAPTGWSALPGYALFTFGAGSGSWKPYGIVNDSIVGSGSNGNTSNPGHNPMLLGPVDFEFVFAPLTAMPTITGVEFYWGSGGEHRTGSLCTRAECTESGGDPSVPEPQTLALLAGALLAMATLRRRYRSA